MGNIEVVVVRKPIKNLHLSVLPPDGKVRVSSPLRLKDDMIRTLIATRIPWIRKHQAALQAQQRENPREYVSGESHYLFGKRYRLDVELTKSNRPRISVKGKSRIVLQTRQDSSAEKREQIFRAWYRTALRPVATELLEKWSGKIGVRPASWGIKRMKTRWGTCQHEAERIWLNLELAKKPFTCIEYVVVHELLHLIEKRHNERFLDMLTDYLPAWQSTKDELNRFILASEKWNH
jgi:predicted metal-dependent hydrolase